MLNICLWHFNPPEVTYYYIRIELINLSAVRPADVCGV